MSKENGFHLATLVDLELLSTVSELSGLGPRPRTSTAHILQRLVVLCLSASSQTDPSSLDP